MFRSLFLVLAFFAGIVLSLDAQGSVTLNSIDTGWYDSTGFHGNGNKNYISGDLGTLYRDYFVFDLAGVSSTIVGAQLQVWNPSGGYSGPAATYTNYDVTTSIPDLMAFNAGRVDIFGDLGTGTVFATHAGSLADNGTYVVINLNSSAIAAINVAHGGKFAIGGDLATSTFDNFIFGFTSDSGANHLVLETATGVPKPANLIVWSVLAGLGVVFGYWRARK